MKNKLRLLALLALPLAFSSCSKDDDGQIIGNGGEAIIKVEVTNSEVTNFEEVINIQVVGNDIENTDLTGVTWDEVQKPHATTKWFMKQGDTKPAIVYQTTKKVTALTYAATINSKLESTVPQVTTLKFYADGKLIKTETLTTLDQVTQVSIPIVVSEY